MSKQSFDHLLGKYMAGECTPAEKQLVEQWYELLGKEEKRPQSEADWKIVKAKMWLKVRRQTARKEDTVVHFYQQSGFRIAAAACILVALGLIFYLYQPSASKDTVSLLRHAAKGRVAWENRSPSAQTVQLSDGSKAHLQPHARLAAPENFTGDTREINLEGDAFFEVAHNPEKPFLVHVGNVVTKVLGTSFWIRAAADQPIEVAVKTGKVAVFEKTTATRRKETGVVLTPNLKVTYFAEQQQFVAGLVEKPEIIKTPDSPPAGFNFQNTPLSEVVATLERAYGIELFFENEALKNCTLTGNLDGMEMYEKLEAIGQSLGASYQVQGTRIALKGKGCL